MESVKYIHGSTFSIPYYLVINGYPGIGSNNGKFKFIGGYYYNSQLEGRGNIYLDVWCDDNHLNYVTADTFEELVEKLENFIVE